MTDPRKPVVVLLPILLSGIAAADETGTEPLAVLNLPDTGRNPAAINYNSLPTLPGEHAVINCAAPGPHADSADKIDIHHLRLNLHNYLARYDGRFWCIWSDGPKVEDWPTQEIKYATSADGLTWSAAKSVTGIPTPTRVATRGNRRASTSAHPHPRRDSCGRSSRCSEPLTR